MIDYSKNTRGSEWRKWDLHIHTPLSIVQKYGGDEREVWEKYLTDLENLPIEIKVLGINDYLFLDGYERLKKEKEENCRLSNIDLLLPVVEFRIQKFSGVDFKGLKRINMHVIFSEELAPETIKSQFLNALHQGYQLSPHIDENEWSGCITRTSLEDLGKRIKESVPKEKLQDYRSDIEEGFNNLNLNDQKIKEILTKSSYFKGKYLLAVGKTEWDSLDWTDGTIAEKKDIINSTHIVFTASESISQCQKAKEKLIQQGVNDLLLDCSDAHDFSDSIDKDKIGNCFTWIKADPTFEGLKQILYEPKGRVHIGDRPPPEPIHKIERVNIDFPSNTEWKNRDGKFCLAGKYDIFFSPNFTCVIGGRGTGKSSLLNLIHERLRPNESNFFEQHKISQDISTCVSIDEGDEKYIEFISQNEVEEFAKDQKRFTEAIFSRLKRIDNDKKLSKLDFELQDYKSRLEEHENSLKKKRKIYKNIADCEREKKTNEKLIKSFSDKEYLTHREELDKIIKNMQKVKRSQSKYDEMIQHIKDLIEEYSAVQNPQNKYDQAMVEIKRGLQKLITKYDNSEQFTEIFNDIKEKEQKIRELTSKIEDFLKERGLSQENINDVADATNRIANLDHTLSINKQDLDVLENFIYAFNPESNIKEEFETAICGLLEPISDKLDEINNDHVKKIKLEYYLDEESAKQALLDNFYNNFPFDLDEGRRSSKEPFADILFSKEPLEILEISQESYIESMKSVGRAWKTTDSLCEYFSDYTNYEIFKLEIKKFYSDVESFKAIRVTYDGKELQDSSFGQRCTAAIVVLLLLGNTPIIIDEPEAHLDSALISQYLIDLIKSKKTDRQVIFATHNANFVINGDAELIHVLTIDEATKLTKITSTTIENLNHREKLLALEGGKEAFDNRGKKYSKEN